jgi:predicted nucleotidyltransferase
MPDVFKVLDLFVAKVREQFAEEVDLIAYYGSRAQGTATASSDLDFFYVPAEGKNPPVGRTVLIDGILFDFWPIPWDRLEGFATGRTRPWTMAPGMVYHAKVAYKRSDEAEARLEALKQKIVALQQPEARPEMIRRALDAFPKVLANLGNLRLAVADGPFAAVRDAGIQVLLAAWESLALANQAFFDRGFRSILAQSSRLRARPADFEQLATTLATAMEVPEILAAAERLALGTRAVLREAQQSVPAHVSVAQMFDGAYPELKDGLRKVLAACEQHRPFDASLAAWAEQGELSVMLANVRSGIGARVGFNLYSEIEAPFAEVGLPDLMGCTPNDLPALAGQAQRLDRRLQQWLSDHNVDLQAFETVEQFARSL